MARKIRKFFKKRLSWKDTGRTKSYHRTSGSKRYVSTIRNRLKARGFNVRVKRVKLGFPYGSVWDIYKSLKRKR